MYDNKITKLLYIYEIISAILQNYLDLFKFAISQITILNNLQEKIDLKVHCNIVSVNICNWHNIVSELYFNRNKNKK